MPDLSVEEANKIRMSMGMAPLPVPGAAAPGPSFKPKADENPDEEPASTIETREAAAWDNWKALEKEKGAQKRREELKATLAKEKEKASRFAKLEGKGLADTDDAEDDMAWLKGSKKRAKKIAKAEAIQKELEERERLAAEARQYTEADLAGVRVGHEVDQFGDEDQVLVLKDTAVDQEDDDELEAVSLREKEMLQEKMDSKKKKKAYNPYDDDPKSLLSQYDEEIEGKKRNAFTLDGQGRTVEEAASAQDKPQKVAISLDILKDDTPANDYMDISEVKIKKNKKKKSKSSKRRRVEDEEDMFELPAEEPAEDTAMEVDETAVSKPKKKAMFDESFNDDEDLQASLAAQRKQALKKRKKMRPEDLARQIRETSTPQTPVADGSDVLESTEAGEDEPALVIDETTEFVQNLGATASDDDAEARKRQRQKSSRVSNGVESVGLNGQSPVDDEGDVAMGHSYAEAEDAAESRDRSTSRALSSGPMTETGLEQEKTVDMGLAATLQLLRQRNMLQASDGTDRTTQYRDRQKFLAEKHREEGAAERMRKEHREKERNSARWANMTPREREEFARKNNNAADQLESRKLADIFNKEYKPSFELKYFDEHGRDINAREAFKKLSHQFHGKGSGNTKTKKHLDKIEAEKRRMAESSLDTSRAGGIGNAQDQQAKKHKMAGVRLQ